MFSGLIYQMKSRSSPLHILYLLCGLLACSSMRRKEFEYCFIYCLSEALIHSHSITFHAAFLHRLYHYILCLLLLYYISFWWYNEERNYSYMVMSSLNIRLHIEDLQALSLFCVFTEMIVIYVRGEAVK